MWDFYQRAAATWELQLPRAWHQLRLGGWCLYLDEKVIDTVTANLQRCGTTNVICRGEHVNYLHDSSDWFCRHPSDPQRGEIKLWHIAYRYLTTWAIIVATTRPETMLGDTAVAVHPDDDATKLIGTRVMIPHYRNARYRLWLMRDRPYVWHSGH